MRRFTREELAELDRLATSGGKVPSRLLTIMGRQGYIRALTSTDAMAIYSIYQEAAPEDKERLYVNCGSCLKRIMKKVAAKYYADLEAYAKEEAEPKAETAAEAPKPAKKKTSKKK